MKKFRLISALLMLFGLTATAQESISVNEVLIPQGKQAMMEVMFHFNENHDYVSYQFKVNLPEGISFVTDDVNKPITTLGDGQPASLYSNLSLDANSHIVTCASNPSTPINGTDGVLVRILVKADENLLVDSELSGSITNIIFSHINAVAESFDDATFTVKIAEPRILFDESSTILPSYEAGVKDYVTMKRTINAGEWSTICLPFTLQQNAAKTIFGNDVELYKFTGFETTIDENTFTPTAIKMNFTKYNLGALAPMTGGQPFLIKTSKSITEIKPDATVTLVNEIKANAVSDANYDAFGGSFKGTFVSTTIPAKKLFISGNKFWYSTGLTTTKAFRGWFDLDLVLNEEISLSRVTLNLTDGETTQIVSLNGEVSNDLYYDLQGRPVQNPSKKGLYIKNGRKEVVK